MSLKSSTVTGLMLGIALGVVVGTYVLGPNLPGGSNQENTSAIAMLDEARDEAEAAKAQAKTVDRYIASIAEGTVDASLIDRSVLVVTTPDASDEDVEHVDWLLRRAGAIDAGVLKLEKKFLDQESADSLKRIVTDTLPAGAQLSTDTLDPGMHAGEALGYALASVDGQPSASDEDRTALLEALKQGGFISYKDSAITPTRGVLLVTGNDDGSENSFAAATVAALAQGMDSQGVGVVVAGRLQSAEEGGVIGRIRQRPEGRDNVSTVDSVDQSFGRMGAVLAMAEQLEGGSGAYGAATDTDAAAPPVVPR
ncbi:copper transporter [Corynebacterium sp.]|uniref:copper transporter n=1 Tax=Corynebacterium sp. TaxID=1720 RepID=UPI0026DCA802|nr:copper transporter [Corynebacterium sp.]MDO5077328.1 copper transporter [Corynebacterium sp.]